ncbi:ribonucleotide reductase subunit 2 [Testudinid alphaherpesvirus 3]|uniref:ribonucleoside-diphosphate reductase n=2 Tax=Herpesvirales TaxID=548681 RepID=A0A0K1R194_9ALPH|nr:ribonucleotide reductase subunit 2 [Testudinid alphaherpesvirus 3]AIU39244.1 ribonucleotide reductase subunit 2 [Testudinid alphaherpesvirus 3]AIU39354.1 ribonucleotide reductase subunit 2 [Testudinid alphaherpesvirus 3]AKI81630.1 ribonucleotide reductase subunit 2 [Testudinid alphaherpesvirus 3]AKI81734.1 ribonucleotide reductase subunit 2 [Testudinid alphaherpesvirus 3]AKV40712.1 UL40 ribonucleotide reductase small subunit [Testudinid alphaherpesvirus 3]
MADYYYHTECEDLNILRNLAIKNRWAEDEFMYTDDIKDFSRLDPEALDFYRFIFTFLSAADDKVNINLDQLKQLFPQKDVHHYYATQEDIECVHSRTYAGVQLALFNNDDDARRRYIEANVSHPTIETKFDWLNTKIMENESVPEKYLLMILVEGIFFVASFASIAYLRNHGGFNSVCRSNDLISRDEAIHTQASCCIFNNYLKDHEMPTDERIRSLFTKAVEIECDFLSEKFTQVQKLVDIKAIHSFIRFSADRLMRAIKREPIYNEPAPGPDFPLAFMYIEKNTNFFEQRSTSYCASLSNDL